MVASATTRGRTVTRGANARSVATARCAENANLTRGAGWCASARGTDVAGAAPTFATML